MASESTPAPKATSTRKKTTKRGPTKATALKALGLTKEDLELLAQVKQAREAVQAQSEIPTTLNFPSPQLPEIPFQAESTEIASTPQSEEPVNSEDPEAPKGPFFVRNLRGYDVGLRLERQGKDKKRFDLKPRGQRGDLKQLQEGDLEDETLLSNVGLQVVEIITATEAKKVISGQTTNQQTAVHPAMAMLRSELGEPYTQDQIKIDPEFNSQGIVVAHSNPQGGGAGELPGKGRGGIDWEAARSGQQNNVAPGGNAGIISDGFQAAQDAAQADAIARRKNLEGPAAAGIRSVVVEPTQRG